MRNQSNKTIIITTILIAVVVTAFLLPQLMASNSEKSLSCQNYHTTNQVNNATVRSCAAESCAVIGSLTPADGVCVRGVAYDNPNWLLVDVTVNGEAQDGYVLANLVEPGLPNEDVNPFQYCNAHQPYGTLNIRKEPKPDAQVIRTISENDIVCVTQYGYFGASWVGLQSGGYISGENLVYSVADIDCEVIDIVVPTERRECASFLCNVIGTIAPGGTECIISDVQEDAEWVGFTYDETGNVGWAYAPYIRQISPEGLTLGELTPQAVTSAQLPPQAISVADINVRGDSSLEAARVGELARQAIADVRGVSLTNDWYLVRTGSLEGWVAASGVEITGSLDNVPVYDNGQIVATTTPLPTSIAQLTTPAAPIQSGAVTVTPTPEVCKDGQTVNCITPTPGASVILPVSTPYPGQTLLAQDAPFNILRFRDFTLASPGGNTSLLLRLPNDWKIDGNNILFLDLTYTQTSKNGETNATPVDAVIPNSSVEISLDGRLISSVELNESVNNQKQRLEVVLPNDLLADSNRALHRLDIRFNAQDACEQRISSSITSSAANSYIHLEYRELSPLLNLAQYPRPFYNLPLANEREVAYLVLPANPSQNMLDAASSVVGGLGFLSGNEVDIKVRTAEQLTDEEYSQNNLIMVGSPSENNLIADLYSGQLLLTQMVDDAISFNGEALAETDGVVQLIANPRNEQKAIMVVSGMTDEGVLKGAQAVAGPPSPLQASGPLTIVTDSRSLIRTNSDLYAPSKLTLADLGISGDDLVLRGLGTNRFDTQFAIPAGTVLGNDSYVDVYFNNSDLLETGISSVSVLVNEIPVGSTVLNDEDVQMTASGLKQLRAPIPPNVVISGQNNTLTFLLETTTDFECFTPDDGLAWFTLSAESGLNLSYLPASANATNNRYISQFPAPFNQLANLSDLWINLPANPTNEELEQTMRLLSRLGASVVRGEGITPRLNVGELPSGVDLTQYNFILIGRPSTNPLIRDLNTNLPQPFVEGSDELEQKLDDVSYRLLPGFEVGVLQRIVSPWNASRSVLVLTGTGVEGQAYAVNAIANSQFDSRELSGDVVFVTSNNVNPIDSKILSSPQELLQAVPDLFLENQQIATNQAATSVAAITTTPGATQVTPNATLQALPPTPVITVVVPTVTPTEIPIIPLTANEITTAEASQPAFVNLLLVVTAVVMILLVIGVLIRFLRPRSR